MDSKDQGKIVRYSNWGYWDQLDGKTLTHGEPIMVTFPSGKEIFIGVHITRNVETVSDHGSSIGVDDVRAYWKTQVEGVDTLVPLIGLRARRL